MSGQPPTPAPSNTVVLDVRSADERANGYLEGSVPLDFNSGEFADALPGLDKHADYLVYCAAGGRAAQAAEQLREAGAASAENLGSLEDAARITGAAIVR
ncbi:rhodanese-like domain-containing protein [Leucobacter weissii]|uniref:Rhodanese-like domain-containing protein n=1 Tax=Leucobacter weissii TaxID=1983706 RepID=A0A939MPQ0_9MICO|nr:rhodanese-like domain-containing protein [Leucobacter weissii]MBO1902672.1 rhodanese-like domain-containing protein [Leucobacter weissii]